MTARNFSSDRLGRWATLDFRAVRAALTPGWGAVLLATLASLACGALVVRAGYVAVVAAIAIGVLSCAAVSVRRAVADEATGWRDIAIYMLLVLYVAPMLLFARSYALIGYRPVYLADVLIALAAVLAVPRMWTRGVRTLSFLCCALALLMLHAVLVAYYAGYPGATRGFVMILYPLVGASLAGWLSVRARPDESIARLARLVFPLVSVGLALSLVLGALIVSASYGLYLATICAFAVAPKVPRRRLFALAGVLGIVLLVGFNAKRGPMLAIAVAVLGAWLASRPLRSGSVTVRTVLTVSIATVALAFAASTGLIVPSGLPVVGRLVERATATTSSANPEAANNVALRTAIWSYALRTTAHSKPLFGMGAFHPIEVSLDGNDLVTDPESGVHNSFIGYAFYAGFPAGALIVCVFAFAMWRIWRVRRRSIYAPPLFGALCGVIVTASTNVALETTYIAGPSWLIVAAAVALSVRYANAADAGRPPSELTWACAASPGGRALPAHVER